MGKIEGENEEHQIEKKINGLTAKNREIQFKARIVM
jgi:hypothetical protein